MHALFRAALLMTLAAGFMTMGLSAMTPAQVKDKDKKGTKATAEESGATEVYKSPDGWRFRIKSGEGKTIAVGTIAFDKKDECLKAVDAVKTALEKGKVEVKEEKK